MMIFGTNVIPIFHIDSSLEKAISVCLSSLKHFSEPAKSFNFDSLKDEKFINQD